MSELAEHFAEVDPSSDAEHAAAALAWIAARLDALTPMYEDEWPFAGEWLSKEDVYRALGVRV